MQKYFGPESGGAGEIFPNSVDKINKDAAESLDLSPTMQRTTELAPEQKADLISLNPDTAKKYEEHTASLDELLKGLDRANFYNV